MSESARIAAGERDRRLRRAGQEHLMTALERLDAHGRERLAAEIDGLDLDLVTRLVRTLVLGDGREPEDHGPLDPPEVVGLPVSEADRVTLHEARAAGARLLSEGRVALVLLAGGQGTRLGFDGPKGDFPFGPVSGRTLFSHHAAKVAALRQRHGARLPWYVMTSPANDAETRAIFARDGHYGLPPDSVRFFVQGTLPAVDRQSGRILLEAPDRLALSPDGHGGLLRAMRAGAVLEELRREGVGTIVTFQVDNPMLRLARAELLGHHALARAEMSSVVVRKRSPEERMGVVVRAGGRTRLVEYSDLSQKEARRTSPDGALALWAGSIAVHCLEIDFVERITAAGASLPYHRAVKRVPHFSPQDGAHLDPDEPNAVKLESFLFDALPFAERTLTLEVDRAEEFAPIKNAEGDDSPDSARRELNRLYADWLEAAGAPVPRDPDGEPSVDLEIDPRMAMSAEELAQRLPAGTRIEGPTALADPGFSA